MLHLRSTTIVAGLLAVAVTVPAGAADLEALIAAAKAEGSVTTIALPHDWCNYGGVIEGFKAKYRNRGQRAEPGRGLRRRTRGDPRQQGQQGSAGARRHRRRLLLRPGCGQGGTAPALQGLDLGRDPGEREGSGGLLVRRLLRRAQLRGEHRHRHRAAGRLGRPAQARVRQLGGAGRRPARLEPGDPRGLCRGARGWRRCRCRGRPEGPRLFRRDEQGRQLRAR